MSRFSFPILAFIALLGIFLIGLQRDPTYVPSPLIGKSAPVFNLPLLSDDTQTLGTSDIQGEIYLLNVWATWCAGCRQEHQALMEIAARTDIPIYGLNWKDDPDTARLWLVQLGDPYAATVQDLDGRVAIDWGVYGAPETFLIDAEGIVLHKHVAPITMEIWTTDFLPKIMSAQAKRQ